MYIYSVFFFQNISNTLKLFSVNDCKTRWRTIRDSYKKNLKKRRLGTGSAAATKSKYNDDSLSFLDNIENERR